MKRFSIIFILITFGLFHRLAAHVATPQETAAHPGATHIHSNWGRQVIGYNASPTSLARTAIWSDSFFTQDYSNHWSFVTLKLTHPLPDMVLQDEPLNRFKLQAIGDLIRRHKVILLQGIVNHVNLPHPNLPGRVYNPAQMALHMAMPPGYAYDLQGNFAIIYRVADIYQHIHWGRLAGVTFQHEIWQLLGNQRDFLIVNVDFDPMNAAVQIQELYAHHQTLTMRALSFVDEDRDPNYTGLIIGGNFEINTAAGMIPPAHQGRYAFEPLDKENEVEVTYLPSSNLYRAQHVDYTNNAHFLINIATPTIASVFNTQAVHSARAYANFVEADRSLTR